MNQHMVGKPIENNSFDIAVIFISISIVMLNSYSTSLL